MTSLIPSYAKKAQECIDAMIVLLPEDMESNAVANIVQEANEAQAELEKILAYGFIYSLGKDEIQGLAPKWASLDDSDFEEIAGHFSDALCENGLWAILQLCVRLYCEEWKTIVCPCGKKIEGDPVQTDEGTFCSGKCAFEYRQGFLGLADQEIVELLNDDKAL